MKKYIIQIAMMMLGVVLLASCQSSEWDDHFSMSSSDQTLMEAIDANPQLSEFSKVVKANGLQSMLSSSQSFTVFAPDNNAMQALSLNSDTLNLFLYNHICRYVYSLGDVASADENTLRIKMLNGKYQNLQNNGSALLFGNHGVVSSQAGANNGVLNVINQVIPFYNNIYEAIKKEPTLDSIATYLKARDHYTFLPDKSTVLGVNAKGETVYDSVFNFRNDWMSLYGSINAEDSVYTMLVPSNTAWQSQMTKLKKYFRAYGNGNITSTGIKVTGTYAIGGAKADSLTAAHAREALVQDLVFRKSVDVTSPEGDSLISTNGNVFRHPQYLFTGADYHDVSNGKMYVTDELQYKATDSWQKEIRVEAEFPYNYLTQYAGSTSNVSVLNYPQFANQISNNSFLIVNPTQLSFQRTTVRFRLPNTLAAKYNIYVVTVPASAQDTSLIRNTASLKSTRLKFYLAYVHDNGTLQEDAAIVTPVNYDGGQTPTPISADAPAFITNATQVNKMLVAENFQFPYANYLSSPFNQADTDVTTTAYLRVESDVTTSAALAMYEKTMRIDCIILEPVNE